MTSAGSSVNDAEVVIGEEIVFGVVVGIGTEKGGGSDGGETEGSGVAVDSTSVVNTGADVIVTTADVGFIVGDIIGGPAIDSEPSAVDFARIVACWTVFVQVAAAGAATDE